LILGAILSGIVLLAQELARLHLQIHRHRRPGRTLESGKEIPGRETLAGIETRMVAATMATTMTKIEREPRKMQKIAEHFPDLLVFSTKETQRSTVSNLVRLKH
jgi:hypothetical protein